jgi:hypothetical protein
LAERKKKRKEKKLKKIPSNQKLIGAEKPKRYATPLNLFLKVIQVVLY